MCLCVLSRDKQADATVVGRLLDYAQTQAFDSDAVITTNG